VGEAQVEHWVERVRLAVAADRSWLPNGERVTVSIGIASLERRPCTLTELVKRADEALYAAKAGGRNRFVNWKALSRQPSIEDPAQVARA